MEEIERFSWELLGDLVLEDDQGLPEVYWQARTMFDDHPPEQQREIARSALFTLLDQGLVELFDQGNETTTLEATETQELIQGTGWFLDPPSRETLRVFVRATPAGERAVQKPPPAIAELWRGS